MDHEGIPVPFDDGVAAISAVIADRTHFVLATDRALVASVLRRLDPVTGVVAYLDGARADLFRIDAHLGGYSSLVWRLPFEVVLVATVPKTTPASQLRELTRCAPDGSQDLILLHDQGSRLVEIPRLLLAALEHGDPSMYAHLLGLAGWVG